MNNKKHVIGLMSGTSLDGVDLVYVVFNSDYNKEAYNYKIRNSETVSYSDNWLKKLKDAFHYNKEQLLKLNIEYGIYLADLIVEFVQKNKISKIDFIASHGHTIHHKPNEGYTLQIGDGKTIAKKTNIKVICDFRSQDVRLGGQGAPLVPIGDKLLFSKYDYCLNLGGFANISFDDNQKRIAFDICAVNTVLNHYANKLDLDYDDKGKIARRGTVIPNLLNALNKLDFYKDNHPKSLGIEYVHTVLLPLIDTYNLAIADILHTYIEHIAMQITIQIKKKGAVLVTGGGAFNIFLMERIEYHTTSKIIMPNKNIINYKEALVFAFLGLLRDEKKINCLKSVTGASKDHCSGVVFE